MVPGGLAVGFMSRYFDSGRPCDVGDDIPCSQCRTVMITAARDFARVCGPRLWAEMILRKAERLLAKDLTPMERAEVEGLRFVTRELVAEMERCARAAA